MNGRGVKTYFGNEKTGKYFEAGWADKITTYWATSNRSESGTGYTVYAKPCSAPAKKGNMRSVLYDQTL